MAKVKFQVELEIDTDTVTRPEINEIQSAIHDALDEINNCTGLVDYLDLHVTDITVLVIG